MPELSVEFWIGTGLAAIALALGLGVALAMDAETKGEFRFVVACFLISAGIVVYGVWMWQMSIAWPTRIRLFAAYALLALVVLLTGEAIRWAHGRHLRASQPKKPDAEGDTILVNGERPGSQQTGAQGTAAPPPTGQSASATGVVTPPARPSLPDLNYVPEIMLLYRDKRIEIHNRGRTNLYLWGGGYGDVKIPVDSKEQPRMIAPGAYYYLFAETLEDQFLSALGRNGEGTTTFHAFITTEDTQKHTIRGILLERVS